MTEQKDFYVDDTSKALCDGSSEAKKKSDWLSGGGEMAEVIRAKDWSNTPLGPIEAWPSSLRTTVNMCLASSFPINIIWGRDATQIYNGGYKVLCGDAHPRAMGESYRETWRSAWPAIGESFENALRGRTSFLENQSMFLQRNGSLEETFFTFSLSPIRDDSGEVVGVFHPVTETTAAMLSQRRTSLLRDLVNKGTKCESMCEGWKTIIQTLERAELDLPGIVAFENHGQNKFKLIGTSGGITGMAEFAMWPSEAACTTSGPYIFDDVTSSFGKITCSKVAEPIQHACLFPIYVTGHRQPIGFVGLALSPRLPIDESFKTFLTLLGEGLKSLMNSLQIKQNAESERLRLFEVFMQVPAPTAILIGPEHRYTVANEPYERTVGRKVVGKTVHEAFSPEDVDQFVPQLDKVYRTGQPYIGKALPLTVPDDHGIMREHFFNVGHYPFRDSSGRILGVLAVHIDVTDEVNALKLVAQNESRFRALANSMPVMVWAARPNGEIYYYNQRWTEYTGKNLQDTENPGWKSIVHPDDYELALSLWKQSIESEKPLYIELRIKRHSDAMYRWHLTRAEAAREKGGEVWSWFGTCTDIHEQKILMKELDVAKASAEIANSSKSSFLANMSHEIRTPLAAILGFTEILKSAETAPMERKEYLDIIGRNGEALVRIIDDILDLSKIEAGKIEIEKLPMCLPDLLRDIIAMFSDRARGKGIKIELDTKNLPKFRIESDAIRIRQILINLIGNAIKFTTEGSVTVGGEYKETKDGSLNINLFVSDTGIGISPEQAQKLFKPFTQADNTTSRRFGGTGLGLALSKKLAEVLGGDIAIDESGLVRKGTTFRLNFVAEKCLTNANDDEQMAAKIGTSKGKKLDNWNILVVDDAVDNRVLLKILLQREGAHVDGAFDGEEGIRMALANEYDVLLMDIQMPRVDGYEALARLRGRHYTKPIFALTAHAMKEERNRILAKGFSGHIAKPVNPAELVNTLIQHAGRMN